MPRGCGRSTPPGLDYPRGDIVVVRAAVAPVGRQDDEGGSVAVNKGLGLDLSSANHLAGAGQARSPPAAAGPAAGRPASERQYRRR